MQNIEQENIRFMGDQRQPQKAGDVEIDASAIVDMLSHFDQLGVWRVDIQSSLAYWSRNIFEILGWPYREGPVNMLKAIEAYHPEDRALVLDCLSEASTHKTSFQFVLRLRKPDGTYTPVQVNGRRRVNEQGREELYGTLLQLKEPARTVAID